MAYDLGKATGVVEIDYDGKDLKNVTDDLGKTESATGKLSGGLKKLAGVAAAAFGAIQVGSFLKDSIGAAADLEQSVGAIDAVFKENSGQMHAWAADAATTLGLTGNEYNELATVIGAQLKNGGTSMDELAGKTNELMGTGADLASMFGGTTREAVDALSSALKGERDPIERYGVTLKQAGIDAKAAELGFKKVGGQYDTNAQQAATLALIMEQTADAQGNFGRETNTLSNRLQVMGAQWGNMKASIGELFLPMMTAAATVITDTVMPAIQGFIDGVSSINSEMTPVDIMEALGIDPNGAFGSVLSEAVGGIRALGAAFSAGGSDITSSGFAGAMEQVGLIARNLWDNFQQLSNSELVGMLIGIAGAFVALVGPGTVFSGIVAAVTSALGPLAPLLAKIGPLFRLLGGPIGIIIGLITTLYATNDEFRESMNGLFGTIGEMVGLLVSSLMPVFSQLATTLLPLIAGLFTQLVPVIGQLLTAIVPLIGTLLTQLVPVLAQLIEAVMPIVIQLITALVPIVVQLVTAFIGLVGALLPIVTTLLDLLIPALEFLLPIVISVFQGLVNQVIAALGIIQGVITVVTGIIKGDWAMVWEGIKQIFVGIWNFLKAWFFSTLNNIATVLGTNISGMASTVASGLSAIRSFFVNIWNAIWSFILSILSRIVSFFVNTITNIRNTVTNGFNAVRNAITNAINAARNAIVSVFARIVATIVNAVNNIKNRVKSGFDTARQMAVDAVTRMKEGVTNKFDEIVSFIRDIPGKIKSALGNLGDLLVGAGRDLLNGLKEGINDAWEGVKSTLGGITDQIPDWKGPPEKDATLLVNAGQLVMQGFDDGLKDSIPMIRRTLNSLTGALPGMLDLNPGSLGIDLNPRRTQPSVSSMYNGTGTRSEELKLLSQLAERLMEVGTTDVTIQPEPGEDRSLTGRRITEVLNLRAIALKGSGIL